MTRSTTQACLEQALNRLLTGQAATNDGDLTISSLCREAGRRQGLLLPVTTAVQGQRRRCLREPRGLATMLCDVSGHFDAAPAGLSAREKVAYDRLLHFYRDGFGYAAMMNQSPQTIGYALADSPVAMAAYYYDKIAEWTDSGGNPEKVLTYDEMLDAISLYWLTNTGTSSSRSYWEARRPVAGRSTPCRSRTSRSRSPCSPRRSTARRAAGPNAPSATLSTGTRSTGTVTSPRGSRRDC